jgi:hypothetical protein
VVETEVIKELEAEPDDSQFQNPKQKKKTTTQISKFIGTHRQIWLFFYYSNEKLKRPAWNSLEFRIKRKIQWECLSFNMMKYKLIGTLTKKSRSFYLRTKKRSYSERDDKLKIYSTFLGQYAAA